MWKFSCGKRILERISGAESVYQSPTDMGVNKVGFAITDDAAVQDAAKMEVIRRYLRCNCEYIMGFVDKEAVQRVNLLMNELGISIADRNVVGKAKEAQAEAEADNKGNAGIFAVLP